MYICICNAVTENDIRSAIEGGANNLRQLQNQLGVATQCGACSDCARAMLRSPGKPERTLFGCSAQPLVSPV